jgi:hypothetical protein
MTVVQALLRGDVMYATLYRFTSGATHASDFGAHVEIDQGSDDRIWQIEPSAQECSNRIDQRLDRVCLDARTSQNPEKVNGSRE